MDGEEPPSKKKKPSTEPNSIHSLPDDLIASCLARVSRLHYPILSLVSKSFRSVVASPELYQTRNLLNRNESCLYVCLQISHHLNPSWFTLCKKPNQTLTKKKEMSSGFSLVPIRIMNSLTVEWSTLIAVDSNIYAISREYEYIAPCTNLSYLDCRTHTWLEAPRMRIAHTGTELDGKLYLPGSNENQESLSNIEVFNTETQTWNDLVPSKNRISKFNNMEGKILTEKVILAFDPKELTWVGKKRSGLACMCMIENITYGYHSIEGFEWSNTGSDVWRNLEGLEGLPKFAGYSNVTLVDYGGNMIVLWDEYVHHRGGGSKEKIIWCAEISLEKSNNGEEIWGKVEWFDEVLRVPMSYKFLYSIAASV